MAEGDQPADTLARGVPSDSEVALSRPGAEQRADLVGRTLLHFRIVERLGEGGMGVVYRAIDETLRRPVALKVLGSRFVIDERNKELIFREARSAAALTHPHIAAIYEVHDAPNGAFCVMELVEGETLGARIARDGRIPVDQALRWAMQIAGALARAHAAGVVHRDLKTDNVMITQTGDVKLLDFGLAKVIDVEDPRIAATSAERRSGPAGLAPTIAASAGSTEHGRVMGTPAYMAPEQARGEEVDARADVFAFGVVLYEMLTGEAPFAGRSGTPWSWGDAGSTDWTPARPLRDLAPHVPRGVEQIVQRCLAYESGARFAGGAELMAALEQHAVATGRRKRASFGALAVAVLAAVTLLAARTRPAPAPMCQAGRARVDAVWGEPARAAVSAAFAATKLSYATTAAERVTRDLDGYAAEWAKMDDQACFATRVHGGQSQDVLALREACLMSRLRQIDALSEQLRTPNGETVTQASQATKTLSPIADCADVAALTARVRRPGDPAILTRLDALDQTLAGVQAKEGVGKGTEAEASAASVIVEAEKLGYPPLLARAQYWRGRASADLGDDAKSIPAFQAAFEAALAGRDEETLGWSAIRLAQEYVYASRAPDFELWASIAQASLSRGEPDRNAQWFLDHLRCISLYLYGKVQSRLRCLDRHAEEVARFRPLNDWELTTLGLAAMDAGHDARGVDYARRGYLASLQRDGPLHPRTVEMRVSLVNALLHAGDCEGAIAEGLAVLESGPQQATSVAGRVHQYLSGAYGCVGRREDRQRELGLAAPSLPSDEVDFALGRLDWSAGHIERAIVEDSRSLATILKTLPPDHADVILVESELGDDFLSARRFHDARAVLERAVKSCALGEANPVICAMADYRLARAIWGESPAERGAAVERAREARDAYERAVPEMSRRRRTLAAWDDWIVAHSIPGK